MIIIMIIIIIIIIIITWFIIIWFIISSLFGSHFIFSIFSPNFVLG